MDHIPGKERDEEGYHSGIKERYLKTNFSTRDSVYSETPFKPSKNKIDPWYRVAVVIDPEDLGQEHQVK